MIVYRKESKNQVEVSHLDGYDNSHGGNSGSFSVIKVVFATMWSLMKRPGLDVHLISRYNS